ncbi:uncharacterized protein B0P05DRAFT_550007 [Gilbertella persicaria]|uniref:uncharacterized protein n=1 Tax=Gilbertella persicaria TaxID=101096 RepID=UPI00221F2288|nr:uncharacterized protein B0P05DRAFT_550000 [Gilbertella persicaria]XP_051432984.1 uncharacterized protein B0P05DRAFT_550007 [Gilbertella persicaria]KAI8071190.1 hypothetical protein B0P05DRAFT_550000 [Gilbertella persicaria]KAI8071194.1 hypothetical protein B0P05DRAFT_550007 [Gilbertella persicaria]
MPKMSQNYTVKTKLVLNLFELRSLLWSTQTYIVVMNLRILKMTFFRNGKQLSSLFSFSTSSLFST